MATADDVQRLRRLTSEPTDAAGYTATVLGAYVDTFGSVEKAAAEVWREKAASLAGLVDVTEGSSSRKLSQARESALKMAALYDQDGPSADLTAERPRTRAIVRR